LSIKFPCIEAPALRIASPFLLPFTQTTSSTAAAGTLQGGAASALCINARQQQQACDKISPGQQDRKTVITP
jgi:hypothetical protein